MVFFFLGTKISAHGRLVIFFLSLSAFCFAHTDNGFIEHLILFQSLTTETEEARRITLLCDKLKEILFRFDNFHTHLLHVGDSAWWVDGRVLVYRSKSDASFFCKLQDHVAILTARISQFYLSIVPFLYALQEANRLIYLFL